MKILAIRGKNLASLENEFEINFEQEPLASAGIFAITGPTGAGKSTLLDALCLALFDDVPRLNKAEQLKIEDENQDNITLKDSRNILRKGAADGYAEVDFRALNGDKYSTRWMVRRARNKVDGALQNSAMQLFNRTSGQEEQGGKTELKNKLTELIGLNFEQFTRAVLLAQGDFANFLKAKQSEKAELLEKLTGTDIYSRISIEIYESAAEAKNNLELLKSRIGDINPLSGEELNTLNEEMLAFKTDIAPLKMQSDLVAKKQNWITQEENYLKNIQEAENQLANLNQLLQSNQNRYEYLHLVELAQEIRDSYFELQNKIKLQQKQQQDLYNNQTALKELVGSTLQTEETLQNAQTNLQELESKYLIAKPQIDKAKELDIEIKTALLRVKELKAEHDKIIESINKADKTSKELFDSKVENDKKQEVLNSWFLENKYLDTIIDNQKIIFNRLAEQKNNQAQLLAVEESLKTNKDILETYNKQLEKDKEEAQHLNELLPSEVIVLRKKLIPNEPCSVCGSLEHPYMGLLDQEKSIKEEELEKSKQKTTERIEKSKLNIEATQKLITQYETNRSSFEQMLRDNMTQLHELLQNIEDWEIKLVEGTLQTGLQQLEKKWSLNRQELENCTRIAEGLAIKIENESENRAKLSEELQVKSGLLQSFISNSQGLEEQRSEIFGGKSIQMIEERYNTQKKEWTKAMELARKNKDENENKRSKLEGSIQQLELQINQNKEDIKELRLALDAWVNSGKHSINMVLLQELMLKTQEWINIEKKYLYDLKNQELVLIATLKERQTLEQKHQLAVEKPLAEETKELLNLQLKEIDDKKSLIDKGMAALDLKLKLHNEAVLKMKAIEKELQRKEELSNNWAKLNEMLGSANGNKFKTIAQGYTLDVLLDYANKHLEDLNRRYKLEKIPNTLALQVIDRDMFDDVRPVHCLSGGESFLISLALALGLSSLSSNKIKIESLFIDEGFGSLDMETLSIAMDALENLQTQGRKIGVISHVEEMKERISTQIQVVKSNHGGSSKIIIVG